MSLLYGYINISNSPISQMPESEVKGAPAPTTRASPTGPRSPLSPVALSARRGGPTPPATSSPSASLPRRLLFLGSFSTRRSQPVAALLGGDVRAPGRRRRRRRQPCLCPPPARMDQRKAIFRAKLRESKEKQQTRIDPSLVRYNEYDQPICRVCNITLKSEALWPAHQVSRKHHEAKAAEAAKAAAGAASRGNNAKQEQVVEPQKQKSSTLPANFFDNQGSKRHSDDTGSEGRSVRREVAQPKAKEASTNKQPVRLDQMAKKGSQTNTNVKGILPGNFFDYAEDDEAPAPKELTSTSGNNGSSNHTQVKGVPDGFFDNNRNGNGMQPSEPSSLPKEAKSSETAQSKGSLPEGFFDNKDADLRARGIQPQKVDMNDAYKEFEKEIQVDLQEVDDRLEEEEIDAAAEREEYLTLEQREYRQRVDMLKKQLIESNAARTAKANSKPAGMIMESSSDSSSDEDDDSTDFAVDWRAQHLK